MARRGLVALAWIEAAIIAALVIAWIVTGGRTGFPGPVEEPRPARAESRDSHQSEEPGSRGTTRRLAETRSLTAVASSPFVEPEVAWSPDDPVGIMLYGKITRQDGKPLLREVTVSLEESSTGEWRSAGGARNVYDAYAITGLAPGKWTLWARDHGFREIQQAIELNAAHPRQRLDITLQPGVRLKVKFVTPEGQLLSDAMRAEKFDMWVGVTAVATVLAPTADLPMTERASHHDYGAAVFREGGDDVPKGYGILELREGPPVYVSAILRHVVLETKLVPLGYDEVIFTIPIEAVRRRLSAVKLKLVDADTGDRVSKARIDLSDRQSSGPGYVTGEDGTLTKDGLRPGLLHLTIEAPTFERISQYIRLESGQMTDLGTIRLSRAATIDGVVVDERGNPVQTTLGWNNLDRMDFPQPLDVGFGYGSESDGSFKLTGAGRGRTLLIARTRDSKLTTAAVVDTSSGSVSNVRLVVRAGTQVLIDPQIMRGERYLFTITDDAGTPWYAGTLWVPRPLRLTIPPGNYTLRIFDDKALRRSIPLTVGSDAIRVPFAP